MYFRIIGLNTNMKWINKSHIKIFQPKLNTALSEQKVHNDIQTLK